jgi:hypothetical protein
MAASRYHESVEDFRRRTPRVYGEPAAPGEEPEPATATATQEVAPPRPNASTIEGAIQGIGLMAAAAVSDDPLVRRRARPVVLVLRVAVAAMLLAILVALLDG